MNMRFFIAAAFILTVSFGTPLLVNAEAGQDLGAGTGAQNRLVNPLGEGKTIPSFLNDILSIVTDIIGPVIVILMLVYVGFLFVVAQGKEAEIRAARQALQWTVVGALILLGAKVIALGIQATVAALKV